MKEGKRYPMKPFNHAVLPDDDDDADAHVLEWAIVLMPRNAEDRPDLPLWRSLSPLTH